MTKKVEKAKLTLEQAKANYKKVSEEAKARAKKPMGSVNVGVKNLVNAAKKTNKASGGDNNSKGAKEGRAFVKESATERLKKYKNTTY